MRVLLGKIKFKLSVLMGKILMPLFSFLPINKNKIYFSHFDGSGFSDSPKYIALELLKRKKYKIVWAVFKKEEHTIPEGIIKVRPRSIAYFYHIATAKIWVSSARLPLYIKKRREQIYIQTWHGPIMLKKIEYDVFDKLNKNYQKVMVKDNQNIDVMLSNSDFTNDVYRKSFKYQGEILKIGSPKNDLFINEKNDIKKKVYVYFKLDDKVKILLYAPTFRKEYQNNPYDLDLQMIKDCLERKTKEKWVIMVKLHPNAREKINLLNLVEGTLNVNDYSSTEELLCASEILITDYSSLMFDAVIASIPCILYTNDINSYVDERGFYFDLFKLPFKVSQNNSELEEILKNYNKEDIMKDYKKFIKKFALIDDGKASQRVVNYIEKKIK